MNWQAPTFNGSIRKSASLEHWLLAAKIAAARHHLNTTPQTMTSSGSDVVIDCGDLLFKMTAPRFLAEQQNEQATLAFVSGRLSVQTPQVVASGELEGWPYFWMTRVEGVSLASVYPTLSHEERLNIASMLGELLSSLHSLPASGDSWPAFFAAQRATVSARHTSSDAPHLAAQVAPFMEAHEGNQDEIVFLHTEVLDEHILVKRDGERWALSSMIDFADSRPGSRCYEFPALVEFIFRSEEGLFPAFLRSYGWSGSWSPQAFFYWNLLHQFGSVPRMLRAAGAPAPGSLEELAARLYR